MALETGSYIDSLVATNPTATDALAQADDHLRLIKATLKNTFPSIAGAINSTHSELNIMDGDTVATSVTLVDGDRVVVNDDGTMIQVALSDFLTYINAGMTLRDDVVTASSLADAIVATANLIDGSVTSDKIASGAIDGSKIAAGVALSAGMIMPYAGASSPTGWLLCYGQEVSRETYAELFTVISTTYGSGNGSTTFNVPDLRGRVVAGQDDMGGTSANRLTAQTGGVNGDTLGASGGSETHTLSVNEMPSHSHTSSLYVRHNNDGGYNNSDSIINATANSSYNPINEYETDIQGTIDNTGGDGAHNNVQPTFILNYIIKT